LEYQKLEVKRIIIRAPKIKEKRVKKMDRWMDGQGRERLKMIL